jgi:hydroxyquinol 1,2-dioxygenase
VRDPVGELISRTANSHFRPAHVHVLVNVPGTPDGGAIDRPWLAGHYDFVLQPRS